MAAPAWVSTTTATTAGATSLAVSKPASVAAGDLLFGHLTVRNTETLTIPTGFTVARAHVAGVWQTHTCYRIADGSEGATFSWSWSSSTKAVASMSRITGAHQTSPLNVAGTAATVTASATATAPTITTTVDECLLIGVAASADNSSWTSPGTMTERWDQLTSNFGDCSHTGATQALTAAGSTGTRVFTQDRTSECTAFLVAFAPPVTAVFTQTIGLPFGVS